MKVIIAGSRSLGWSCMDCVFSIIDQATKEWDITEVVSGGASGVDNLGEHWAINYDVPFSVFPADWKRLGKSAGYKRNIQMAQYADACLVIWDGESKGAKHMIQICEELKIPLRVEVLDETNC